MDILVIFIAKYFIFVVALFVIGYLAYTDGNTKKFYYHSGIIFSSAVFAWVVAHILKDIIKHPRPDQVLSLVHDSTYSFPSGHTTFIATMGYMMAIRNKRFAYTIICFALVVGFGRVIAGVHYWYDIIGGFVLGVGIGYLCSNIVKRFHIK